MPPSKPLRALTLQLARDTERGRDAIAAQVNREREAGDRRKKLWPTEAAFETFVDGVMAKVAELDRRKQRRRVGRRKDRRC